jgi:hypothetical protein
MTEDQREAWRKALADYHRQQRNQRGRPGTSGSTAQASHGLVYPVRDTNGRLQLSTPDRALAITIVVIAASHGGGGAYGMTLAITRCWQPASAV